MISGWVYIRVEAEEFLASPRQPKRHHEQGWAKGRPGSSSTPGLRATRGGLGGPAGWADVQRLQWPILQWAAPAAMGRDKRCGAAARCSRVPLLGVV
jgi:hypothetical protein